MGSSHTYTIHKSIQKISHIGMTNVNPRYMQQSTTALQLR